MVLLVLGCSDRISTPHAWGSLAPGPFTVGFRQLSIPSEAVEVLIWYPSEQDDLNYLSVTDYILLLERVDGGRAAQDVSDSVVAGLFLGSESTATGAIPSLRAITGMAARDLAPLPGSRPLALWSARHNAGVYQFVLSEYLASHGIVVAGARRVHDHLPPPWSATATEKPRLLAQHVADLEVAFSLLEGQPFIDGQAVTIMAWSYGGESALRFMERHTSVEGVVDLSSTTFNGWLYEPDAWSNFSWPFPEVPVLQIIEGLRMDDSPKPLAATISTWGASVHTYRFPDLKHGDFNAFEGFVPALADARSHLAWVSNSPQTQVAYESTARLVRDFILRNADTVSPGEFMEGAWLEDLPPGLIARPSRIP